MVPAPRAAQRSKPAKAWHLRWGWGLGRGWGRVLNLLKGTSPCWGGQGCLGLGRSLAKGIADVEAALEALLCRGKPSQHEQGIEGATPAPVPAPGVTGNSEASAEIQCASLPLGDDRVQSSQTLPSGHVRCLATCAVALAVLLGAAMAALVVAPISVFHTQPSLLLRPSAAVFSPSVPRLASSFSRPYDPSAAQVLLDPGLLECMEAEQGQGQSGTYFGDREGATSNSSSKENLAQGPLCSPEVFRTGPLASHLSVHRLPQQDQALLSAVVGSREQREQLSRAMPSPRVAFLFLTPHALPFARAWERYFQGHEGKYSIYVHAWDECAHSSSSAHSGGASTGSEEQPGTGQEEGKSEALCSSPGLTGFFAARRIESAPVRLGTMSALDAIRRLLASALADPANARFVLLSHLCVPLRSFDFTWKYLMTAQRAFVEGEPPSEDSHGRPYGYSTHMSPEVSPQSFRRGSMWWAMGRFHAYVVLEDTDIYRKFSQFCKYDMWHGFCVPERYYIPTVLQTKIPKRTAVRSLTFEDWTWQRLHARTFRAQDLPPAVWRHLQDATHYYGRGGRLQGPSRGSEGTAGSGNDSLGAAGASLCTVAGKASPCFLFLRKVDPLALQQVETYVEEERRHLCGTDCLT